MTLAEMRAEILARGFDYLTTARANLMLNQAYQELAEIENWGFLETSTSGAAPLTISDLRTVLSVTDSTQNNRKVTYADRRDLVDSYGDLTTTGAARHYFVDNGVVRTYPVGGTLTVRYVKVPADLTLDADVPLFPARWHYLIVEGAVRRAYQDSDQFEAAEASRQEWGFQLDIMRGSLLDTNDDGVDRVVLVSEWL